MRKWAVPLGVAAVVIVGLVVAYLVHRSQQEAATAADCKPIIAIQTAQARLNSVGTPQLVIIGDSYAAGVGPASVSQSWPRLLTGWHVFVLAHGGAGFTQPGCDGGQYGNEVSAAVARKPMKVVIEGGLNDQGGVSSLPSDANAVLARFRRGEVVVVGPADPPSEPLATLTTIDRDLKSAAAAHGDRYVSLIGTLSPSEFTFLHPTAGGEAVIAQLVQAAIGP
jgi:lysophospholipase L1-like esterase